MSARRIFLALGIIGAALGVFAELPVIVRGVGALVAIAALANQYFSIGSVAIDFAEDDWDAADGKERVFVVRRARHGRRTPNVSVFEATAEGGSREIFCDVQTSANGDVRISINGDAFKGQVRIS